MISDNYQIFALSENTLTIRFGERVDEEQIRLLHHLKKSIKDRDWPFVLDIVVTYHEISVVYDSAVVRFEELRDVLHLLLVDWRTSGQPEDMPEPVRYTIPVCYDEDMAWDRERMERNSGLPFSEIVRLHVLPDYLFYMIGFLPGFMYLGGLHEKLYCPRLEVPRQKVLTGAIGIAGRQTGIYPIESPGGWNIIGRTPLSVFDYNPGRLDSISELSNEHERWLQPLDKIHFSPISRSQFEELKGMTISEYQKNLRTE